MSTASRPLGSRESLGVPSTVRTLVRFSRWIAPLDRFEHQRLDVLGVDKAGLSDATRQTDREPAAARAEIGDHRPFGELERVHDLFGLLPLIAVGALEQAQVERWEETRLLWRRR